jgi:HEAT repeats
MKSIMLTLGTLVLVGAIALGGEGSKLSPATYKKISGKLDEMKANPRKAKGMLPQLKKMVDAHRAELLSGLKHGSALERTLAAKILHLSSGDKAKVAAALSGAMTDKDLEVRRSAASGLARMKVASSAKAFVAALEDVDETVRAVAAGALGRLKFKPAREALVKVLEDENWKVRLGACRALGAIADKDNGKDIAAKLKPLLEDENAYVRMAAAAIVQKLSGVKKDPRAGKKKKGDENVLHELAQEMGAVKEKLEGEHHGAGVQTAEEEVTKKIDALIEMIKKQQQKSESKGKGKGKPKKGKKKKGKGKGKPGNEGKSGKGKKGGQNPSSPMSGEFMTSGGVNHGEKAALGAVGADWGKLPEKERDKIIKAMSAKLPDRYKRMLRLYLMSIAEEGGL